MLLSAETEKLTPTKGTINSINSFIQNKGTYGFTTSFMHFKTANGQTKLIKLPINNTELLKDIVQNAENQLVFSLKEHKATPIIDGISQIIKK